MWYRTYERWDYAPAQGTGIGGAIYLLIRVVVAVMQNYFEHLTTLGRLLAAALAVLLWPLLLLGLQVHVG